MINPLVAVLSKSLDALSMRQQVSAHNLANINTPGYLPLKVDFETALSDLINTGQIDVQRLEQPTVGVRDSGGGKVVLDEEVALLSQTVLQYQTLVRGLNKQLAIMQLAVTEGKR